MPMRSRSTSGARLQVVDGGGRRLLGIGAGVKLAQAERLADARMVDDQERDAAPPVLLADRTVDRLLGGVEAVEMHHAGRAAGDRRLDEEGGQRVLAVGHLDALDRLAPQLQATPVKLDAAPVGDQPARILVARHALGHQIIQAGAHVFAPRRQRMIFLRVDIGQPLDPLGELHPALEPGRLRGRVVLPGGDLAQRPAGVVDLGNHAAARQRAHDGEAPGIVVGEIFEHGLLARFGRSRSDRSRSERASAQLIRKSRMKLRFSAGAGAGGGADLVADGARRKPVMLGSLASPSEG